MHWSLKWSLSNNKSYCYLTCELKKYPLSSVAHSSRVWAYENITQRQQKLVFVSKKTFISLVWALPPPLKDGLSERFGLANTCKYFFDYLPLNVLMCIIPQIASTLALILIFIEEFCFLDSTAIKILGIFITCLSILAVVLIFNNSIMTHYSAPLYSPYIFVSMNILSFIFDNNDHIYLI